MHSRLEQFPDLLHVEAGIFNHLRSSLKFSSQALPINVLLDSLLRPDGDVTPSSISCVHWRNEPRRAIPHIVIGEAPRAGGQWAENPIAASSDIGTLSYAEQLSLPGYSIADHWQILKGEPLPELTRPSRADAASYFAAYPEAVGIAGYIGSSARVEGVSRIDNDFRISSHNLICRNIVLASGTLNINLSPPRSLYPLSALHPDNGGTVLIVGSGFTAADLIISTPPERKIIHLFRWEPDERPSPLKGCHPSAYPEYAEIYRHMKLAAARSNRLIGVNTGQKANRKRSRSSLQSFHRRDWSATYQGFANAKVHLHSQPSEFKLGDEHPKPNSLCSALIKITAPYLLEPEIHDITSFHYAVGRRGSLSYLSPSLLDEVLLSYDQKDGRLPGCLTSDDPWGGEGESGSEPSPPLSPLLRALGHGPSRHSLVSSSKLREKIEEAGEASMEVAPNIFVIGSLTGDSLVRYAIGGCCLVAGKIMDDFGRRKTGLANGEILDSSALLTDGKDEVLSQAAFGTDVNGKSSETMASESPSKSIIRTPDDSGHDENRDLDRRKSHLDHQVDKVKGHDVNSARVSWCTIS